MVTEPEDRQQREQEDREEVAHFWKSFHVWLAEVREKEPLNHQLIYGRLIERRSVKELARAAGLRENVVSSRVKRLKEKFRYWYSRHRGDDARKCDEVRSEDTN